MKRILLKLSGEALAGAEKKGFDEATVIAVAKQIRAVAEEGTQIGIVIGGGNFWRGRTSETINRNKAYQIGMLATVMNCIYVSDICRYLGLKTEEREVYLDEVKDFAECGLCGTAAVISPVGKIVDHDKEICFPSGMEKMGPTIQKLYDTLTGIQMGHIEAPEGWIHTIC